MEYSSSMTPIKYRNTVIIFLIFHSKCFLFISSRNNIQILHFHYEVMEGKIGGKKFALKNKCPYPPFSDLPQSLFIVFVMLGFSYAGPELRGDLGGQCPPTII